MQYVLCLLLAEYGTFSQFKVMEYLTDINCHILLLSETWLTSIRNDVTALVSTYGYTFFRVVRNTLKKKRGGGIGIIY